MKYYLRNSMWRRILTLMISCALYAGMLSCSDDDKPEADPNPSAISFESLTESAEIRGTQSITLTVSDEDGVVSVDVYIDGTLQTTLTSSPYTFEWNTTEVTDGTHIIEVIVTDSKGNEISQEISVVIANTLLTLTVPDDLLSRDYADFTKAYAFLSDEDGTVLTSTVCEPGNTYHLTAPDFEGASFFLTEALLDGSSWTYKLSSYTAITRGTEWTFSDPQLFWASLSPTATGTVSVTTEGVMTGESYYVATNATTATYSTNVNKELDVTSLPTYLYVARTDVTPYQYAMLTTSDVEGIENILDVSAVSAETEAVNVTFPAAATYSSLTTYGQATAGETEGIYNLGKMQNGTFYYPANEAVFNSIFCLAYFSGNNFYVNLLTDDMEFSDLTDFALPTSSIALNDGVITYSATGDYDAVMIGYSESGQAWYCFGPMGENQQIPVLQIPDELADALSYDISTLDNARYFEFEKYDGMDDGGYDVLIDYISQTPYGPYVMIPGEINWMSVKTIQQLQ